MNYLKERGKRMKREPTKQQLALQKSCPHQDWVGIDLAEWDYCVKISDVCPGSPEFDGSFWAGEIRHNRPTPALREAWEYAKSEQQRGARVVKDFAFGVHQVAFDHGEIQYIFVEFENKQKPGSGEITPLRSFAESDPPFRSMGRRSATGGDGGDFELSASLTMRIENRILKVLKAVAELENRQIPELIEHIISQTVRGKEVFSEETLLAITAFCQIYNVSPERPQGVTEE